MLCIISLWCSIHSRRYSLLVIRNSLLQPFSPPVSQHILTAAKKSNGSAIWNFLVFMKCDLIFSKKTKQKKKQENAHSAITLSCSFGVDTDCEIRLKVFQFWLSVFWSAEAAVSGKKKMIFCTMNFPLYYCSMIERLYYICFQSISAWHNSYLKDVTRYF